MLKTGTSQRCSSMILKLCSTSGGHRLANPGRKQTSHLHSGLRIKSIQGSALGGFSSTTQTSGSLTIATSAGLITLIGISSQSALPGH